MTDDIKEARRVVGTRASEPTQGTLVTTLLGRATALVLELKGLRLQVGPVRDEMAMRLRTVVLLVASIPAQSEADVVNKQVLVNALRRLPDIEPSSTAAMIEAAIKADRAALVQH